MHNSTGGFELVVGMLAAAGFGFLIDRAFGLTPMFTLIFAVIGFVGATISLFYQYRAKMDSVTTTRTARVERTDAGAGSHQAGHNGEAIA
ncbi:MAG: AtpZ/AtpI family protein [Actinomycetota bacterium]